MQFLSPSDIHRYKVEQHDVFKFQSGALEVFISWRAKNNRGSGVQKSPSGVQGQSPSMEVWGTKFPEAGALFQFIYEIKLPRDS